MRKILLSFFLLLSVAVSAQENGEDQFSIEGFVNRQMQIYPKSRLLDIYKSCFLNYMGTKSGRDGDKAQALGLHTAYTANGTPYYTEATMVIECKIMYAAPFDPQYFKSDAPKQMYANFPAGIHSMYIVCTQPRGLRTI